MDNSGEFDAEAPCKRTIYVSVLLKNMVKNDRIKYYLKKGRDMNFATMSELARAGKKLRRPSWGQNEYVRSDGKILIHTTPYFGESFNQGIQGYVYVCEEVDVVAEDWVLVD